MEELQQVFHGGQKLVSGETFFLCHDFRQAGVEGHGKGFRLPHPFVELGRARLNFRPAQHKQTGGRVGCGVHGGEELLPLVDGHVDFFIHRGVDDVMLRQEAGETAFAVDAFRSTGQKADKEAQFVFSSPRRNERLRRPNPSRILSSETAGNPS